MPPKRKNPFVDCQYYRWRLFQKSGVWYADGRLGSQKLGKYSLHSRDIEEAKSNLRKLDHIKAVENGLAKKNSSDTDSLLPIAEGWSKYLEARDRPEVMGGVCKKTLKKYQRGSVLHQEFCEANGIQYWNDYDKRCHESYGRELSKKYAPRSLYFQLTLVKSAMNSLVEQKLLPAECIFQFPLSRPQGSETYCYSREQVEAMYKLSCHNPRLEWLRNIICVLACTGLRIGELRALRWSDIDFQGNAIRLTDERSSAKRSELGSVRRMKGKRGRVIPLHAQIKSILSSLKRQKHGRVLCGPKGGIIHQDRVREKFVEHVINPLTKKFPTPKGEVGFEHARFHSFRHYFISQAFVSGATEAEIMEWVGHKDAKTVALYRHLREDDAQRRMQQIDFIRPQNVMDGPDEAA